MLELKNLSSCGGPTEEVMELSSCSGPPEDGGTASPIQYPIHECVSTDTSQMERRPALLELGTSLEATGCVVKMDSTASSAVCGEASIPNPLVEASRINEGLNIDTL